jgi:hypothetical protein
VPETAEFVDFVTRLPDPYPTPAKVLTRFSGLTGGYAPCSSSLGLCVNPHPKPGESANPQPYEKGRYPKLLPYFPR